VIGWLRGRLLVRCGEGEVLLDVGGVGYRVMMPASVLAGLGEPGSEAEFHIHTHVREDALVLYGFQSLAERRCFELLLGAHGVGPALALAMIGVLGPDGLARSVAEEDLDTLCAVPGVGRKTAARLVLDLKAKIGVFADGHADVGAPSSGSVGLRGTDDAVAARVEARAALFELGYGPDEVQRALAATDGAGPVDVVLRQALRYLASDRRGSRRSGSAVSLVAGSGGQLPGTGNPELVVPSEPVIPSESAGSR